MLPKSLSPYQRQCVAEMQRDGFVIGNDWRYTSADDEMASVTVRSSTGYCNRVAFPRTRAIERYYSSYERDPA